MNNRAGISRRKNKILGENIQKFERIQSNNIYYIVSYGGCGSVMLTRYLNIYGEVQHIHSRFPPDELEYVGNDNSLIENINGEHFNGIKLNESDLSNTKVIYIYKDPVKAIYSRFRDPNHLKNIEAKDINTTLDDILTSKEDLYGIEQFFDNWTAPNPNRNYKIICVKYSDIFEKQGELMKTLGITPYEEHVLTMKETKREYPENELNILYEIYQPLIEKMKTKDFIEIV